MTKVYILVGTDPSSVYHSTLKCSAITGRVGWTASIYKGTLQADGTVKAKVFVKEESFRRRPCKRCH